MASPYTTTKTQNQIPSHITNKKIETVEQELYSVVKFLLLLHYYYYCYSHHYCNQLQHKERRNINLTLMKHLNATKLLSRQIF